MADEAYPDALPVGYRLHWYALERVLGQGGFGITHLAHDTNLERRVAIKEYLPSDFAQRRSDATVRPRTESQAERYAWGLERFLAEARTLARFDHPNIVRVHSVFEANNTAYMVMRFEEGESLAALLERRGTLPEGELLGWLLPVLEGLELVHEAGFIHRDIKPENIYLRTDGSPVLLDFGSARQAFGRSKTMTILVAPGYAPLEQYYGDAATQGAWTDIYGLGATCYRAIAGTAPLDAIARAKGVLGSAREVLPPAAEVGRGRYSDRLLAAVDLALQLSEQDRPQSVGEWRRAIVAPKSPTRIAEAAAPQPAPAPAVAAEPAARRRQPLLWGAVAGAGAAIGVTAFYLASRAPPAPQASSAPALPAPAAAPVVAPAPVPAVVAVAAPEPSPRAASPTPAGAAASVAKVSTVALATRPVRHETPADAKAKPAPEEALPPAPAPAPAPLALAPAPAPVAPPPATAAAPRDNTAAQRARDEQLDAAEAALRRGDNAAAAEVLAPWASAGVARAQALLGRAHEGRRGQQSDFEAYVWYAIAARAGEPGAQAAKDKVAPRLQPAEIRQAERIVERWRPAAEGAGSAPR